jgi:tetratricopeptide (TPR) repeat protein
MDLQLISHYVVAILVLPILVLTVRNVVKNSASLFDEDLTAKDRSILKQFAIFLLLPVVALFHELGHAITAKMLGIEVVAFHWSLFFGQVDIAGHRTPLEDFTIALAGNVFQMVATLAALLIAIVSRSPAIVALNIYLYLFSGFSCLVFYPLLSFISWNYDYSIIYGSEERLAAALTGVVHITLTALFAWTFLSQRARLWFARKTRPTWAREYEKVQARVDAEPNAVNLLSLAWQFYFVGLDKSAETTLDRAEALDPALKDVWLLRGYLHQSKGRYNTAVLCFEQITSGSGAERADKQLAARAWMARGHCLSEKAAQEKGGKETVSDLQPILMSYKQSIEANPALADGHYYLAVTLVKCGQFTEAESEAELCQNYAKRDLTWLDPILATMVRDLVAEIRRSKTAQA